MKKGSATRATLQMEKKQQQCIKKDKQMKKGPRMTAILWMKKQQQHIKKD